MSLLVSINSIADSIVSLANDITTRFDEGIYGILAWAFAKFLKVYVLAQIKFMIFAIGFSWATAKALIQDMGIMPALNQALSAISPDVAAFLTIMGFDSALNIIVTAYVTKFVLRFIPGLK